MRRKGERTKCEFDGCERLGKSKGGGYFGRWCEKHHALRYQMRVSMRSGTPLMDPEVFGMSREPCRLCGWDKSFCDRHRLIAGGKYTKDNVIPLCPNCHRIETMKQIGRSK